MNWIGLYTFIRRELERIFRVPVQVFITPWISAVLYVFIFGYIVGKKIDLISGFSYIDFVLPGILAMNVVTAAFTHTYSSLYMYRFIKNIEEILVAPFSYVEMIIGLTSGAIARAVITGIGILCIALFFGAANIVHPGVFLLTIFLVSILFSLMGIVVGLWADNFEQLGILSTFVLMPLSFLGGVFYSVQMLPEKFTFIVYANPLFYFIDSIRYSMLGIHDSNLFWGYCLMIALNILFGVIVWHLFKTGWRIKK